MKDLDYISLHKTDFTPATQLVDNFFVNQHFGMTLSIRPLLNTIVKLSHPYRFVEGRIIIVTQGSATVDLMLEHLQVKKGDIILLAADSVVQPNSFSPDFNMLGILFKDNIQVDDTIIIHSTPEDYQETLQLFHSLWSVAHRQPFPLLTVQHLISAIITSIQYIHSHLQTQLPQQPSRQQQTFANFKRLVNQNCHQHRDIPFYANQLNLTPHYLSTLISSLTGQTVMQWINRAAILRAKVMLQSPGALVSDVAFQLNFPSQSAFGVYFKRQTGLSPSDYQKNFPS
ncbi:MAG: AraC family transcriptional regulator [Bacteroidales bacterium]|nr:AraC family transcriptional regulator [Bacteroidales bacterium]